MLRRDFLKHSALAGATAALSSSLSASALGSDANTKKIAIVSQIADETDYVKALERFENVERVVALGADRLENFNTIVSLIEENRGSVLFGMVEPSDYLLLNQVMGSFNAKWINETAHMPIDGGTRHSETSSARLSLKTAFSHLDPSVDHSYGHLISSYHAIGSHPSVSVSKEGDFLSSHAAKNPFVSFVIKA